MSSLLLVGCGNMGSAMLASWKKNTAHGINNFYVIDPNQSVGETFFSNLSALPNNIEPEIVLFAVKPQQLSDLLPEYKKRFAAKPLYISIAAGKSIGFFLNGLGAEIAIVRAMPNTPALVGKAMTALCSGSKVSQAQKMLATNLFSAFGKAVWVDENKMDAVTAISGSGPAYLFLFLEAFTKAAINAGIDVETAKILAGETLHGSIHLAERSNKSISELRENVTSKGGTTEAALGVLMGDNALENLLDRAVKAAIERAKTLV